MKKLLFLLLFLPFLSKAQTSGFFNMSQTQQVLSGPTIGLSGVLSAFTTFVGSASATQTFQVSGFNLTNSGTVTAPSPMEVSLNNTTFASSVSLTLAGTAFTGQPVTIFLRIKSSASLGSYSGNIAVTSTGATTANEPFTASVLAIPVINETGSLTAFTTTVGTASTAQTFTFTASNLLSNVTWTAGTGMEVSSNGTTYASTAVFTQSGGSASGTVSVRIAAATSVGSYSGNITGTATSATTSNVAFTATVSTAAVAHYRIITIPTTSVTATQTNFPVLIQGTFAYLATLTNGGKVANSSGFDITFSSDAAGTSPLNWEVEQYNPVTGAITAWVNCASLTTSSSTLIYMHYGNSSITTFQGNISATWNTGFGAVWHMANTLTGSGQTVPDATSNANNLTANGSWTSGQQITGSPVGGALQLTHTSSNYFSIGTPFVFTNTSDYTLEGWFNISVGDNTSYAFADATSGTSTNWFSSTYRIFNGSADIAVANTSTTINTWEYLVVVKSQGSSTETVYRNATAGTPGTSFNGVTISNLGNLTSGTTSNMKMAEVRVSNVVRSASWIATCYSNQNNPSGFYSIGIEN